MNEALNLEKAQQQQKKNEETLRELENTIGDVNKDIETIQERRAALKAEIHLLDNDKADLELEIQNKAQKAREKIEPEIQRMRVLILQVQEETNAARAKVEKQEADNLEIEAKLAVLEKEKEDKKDKIEALQQDYMKDRDEPVRLGKGNENLRKAVEHLKADLEKLVGETKAVEDEVEKERKAAEAIVKQKQTVVEQIQGETADLQQLSYQIKSIQGENYYCDSKIERINNELHLIAQNIEENRRSIKYHEDLIKTLSKQISDKLRAKVKVEAECKEFEQQTQVMEKEINVVENLFKEKSKELKEIDGKKGSLGDEQKIFVGQLVKKGLEEKNMQAKIMKLKSDIVQHEKQVQQFQEEENKWIEEIKFLSTIREKMARTASQAMAQARETKEELKVKELLILDLTKKQQETEFRLNSFIALYEEVKNARNKYVSQIQNSS
jgi:chromosome segregation ATPase